MHVYDPPEYATEVFPEDDLPRGTPLRFLRWSAIPGWQVFALEGRRNIACPSHHVRWEA